MSHHRSSCQSHAPARPPRAEFISVALRRLFVWSDVSIRPSQASALSFFILFGTVGCLISVFSCGTGYWQLVSASCGRNKPGSRTRNLFQPEVGPPPSDSDWFMG